MLRIQQLNFFFVFGVLNPLLSVPLARAARPARGLFNRRHGDASMMTVLTSRWFWDKKIRIGILALATFIALC
jgi:hypothetical protein